MPAHSDYLAVPLRTAGDADLALAEIDVPLAQLRDALPGCDLTELAVFTHGREPLPVELVDRDGDGEVDHLRTWSPVRGDGSTRLQFVCPAAPGPRGERPGSVRGAVRLDWAGATR